VPETAKSADILLSETATKEKVKVVEPGRGEMSFTTLVVFLLG